jgi:hypothetical protein
VDLRKAATASPNAVLANGALAQEGLEGGARSLAEGELTAALRELDAAAASLSRAEQSAAADPAIIVARGVCALLRDEALANAGRAAEAADAREAAARDFGDASRLGSSEVRVAAWWNQSLLDERRSRLALLAGDPLTAEAARTEAASARERALAAAPPGSDLDALLRGRAESR